MTEEMIEVTIKLTQFQYAVLAHRDTDPQAVIEAHQQGLANRYAQDLGTRIIDRARRSGKPASLPIGDNTKLVNTILLADGYRNAAERDADIKAWQASKEDPLSPHQDIIA